MALTVTSPLTNYNVCDVNTGWTVGSTVDPDFMIEGVACLADDVDITTSHYTGPAMTAVDMSVATGIPQTLYAWMLCLTAITLDIKSAGGLRIVAEDSLGNQSYWYVGGADTYPGGWEVFTCNTAVAPDANSGTACDLTDVVKLGVGFKNTVKSKLPENCFWDWIRYGAGAALKITGTNAVTDDGWSEVLTADDLGVFGIIKAQKGGYVLKGAVEIGDSAGTLATTFSDDGNILVFDDMPVGDSVYSMNGVGNATGATSIDLKAQVIKSAGGRFEFDQSAANLNTFSLNGSTLDHAGLVTFKAGQTVEADIFTDCLQIDPSTSTFETFTIKNYVGAEGGALLWPGGTTVKNGTFDNNLKSIEITQAASQTYDNLTFLNEDNTTKQSTHLNNGGTDINISKNNGSNPLYYTATGGGVVTFVGASVNISLYVFGQGADLQNANVLLRAADGTGPFPYKESITITSVGTTATVAHTAHGMDTGDKIEIKGANQAEYNGVYQITVTGVNSYTYTFAGSVTSPATGTITGTFIIVQGLTDVNGDIATSRVYATNQPLSGYSRKSTSSPYYKSFPITGEVDSVTGFNANIGMIIDE